MSTVTSDFPVREAMVDADRIVTDRWRVWLRDLRQDLNLRSNKLATVILDGQTASLGVTAFKTDTLPAGEYRVSIFTHVTTVGSVSSSLLASISFTHKTIACVLATAALTTNLTTSVQGTVLPFSIDGGSPISYSTTYAANAAASMAYSIALVLEQVNT